MATGPLIPHIYAPGQELPVFKHSAPKVAEPKPWRDTLDEDGLSLVDKCRRKLRQEGLQNPSLKLEIVKPIDMGYRRGSQIALVKVSDGDLSGKQLVAKFFDPFYFDDINGYLCPLKAMTRKYAQETTAFKKLEYLQGDGIPEFFGSFAVYFELPQSEDGVEGMFREVPLILVEFIAGESMNKLNPSDYTLNERKEIMKAVIELDRRVYEAGFAVRRLIPRDLIVSGTRKFKLTLVDLDRAIVTDPLFKGATALGRWGEGCFYYDAWIGHKNWDWKGWIEKEYGRQ